ncbi:hypothetical protein GH714_023764 [Hevea brasiliensis]|uniref:Uncharacterized protein n=1 Tax=Hevea brasiliensis TaxID=3981 RepID=A0A6A6KR33_HEVBR|nr:hypothetical protein GH714_023764 [Hevea brasiliensis]
MGTEEPKDPLKGVDWKAIGSELQKDPSAGAKPILKKRLPKKIRQIPEYYFLPRRSLLLQLHSMGHVLQRMVASYGNLISRSWVALQGSTLSILFSAGVLLGMGLEAARRACNELFTAQFRSEHV